MATQSQRIVQALVLAGEKGVSNYTLNEICFAYSQRIGELKRKGMDIKRVHIKGSLHKYYLIEPEVTVPLEDLFDERVKDYEYEQLDILDMLAKQ